MWEIVESHLSKSGFRLSPDCRSSLVRFVQDAEKQLDSKLIATNRDEAEANLRTLLNEMME